MVRTCLARLNIAELPPAAPEAVLLADDTLGSGDVVPNGEAPWGTGAFVASVEFLPCKSEAGVNGGAEASLLFRPFTCSPLNVPVEVKGEPLAADEGGFEPTFTLSLNRRMGDTSLGKHGEVNDAVADRRGC